MPIFHFPFMGPTRYYNNPYAYINKNPVFSKNSSSSSSSDDKEKNNSNHRTLDESYLFELFGLKLYPDDVLLICLIFFLYQEGVKDDELFISLILLLLS